MDVAYLDNSATTAVFPEAAHKAYELMTSCFGNPSSLHDEGIRAEKELTAARRAVAALIGAPAEDVIFTAGGTEGNNLAILGAAAARERSSRHAVTTAIEHPSVARAFDLLEQRGWRVDRVAPAADGRLTLEQLAGACREDTALISVMMVNNETGALFEMEEASPVLRRLSPRAFLHTDAVQAAGKLPLKVSKLGVDALTISGHKLHAPKGVGALYLRAGVRVVPQMLGGGQEKGLRSGTQAMPLIAAFGVAARLQMDFAQQARLYETLLRRLQQRLEEEVAAGRVVLHRPAGGVPYIISLSVPGYKSEVLLHFLSERGVLVSSGSACARGKKSAVWTAAGLPPKELDSLLRLSFSSDTTPQDIDRFVQALKDAIRLIMTRK